MRKTFVIASATLIVTAAVQADPYVDRLDQLSIQSSPGYVTPVVSIDDSASSLGDLGSVLDGNEFLLGDTARDELAERVAETAANKESLSNHVHTDVKLLPPAPSSAKLFLSAMLSVGAWHLVRSARHWHFSAIPDWYHAEGPAQIGHAVVLDLDSEFLPICHFEAPAAPTNLRIFERREDTTRRLVDRNFLIPADPRGPPLS